MSDLIQRSEDLANEMQRRMALCTVAQGAETDIGASIHQGRRRAVDDTMVPCSVLIEGDDIPKGAVGAMVHVEQRYVWLAFLPCDPSDPNVAAHAALRDMKRAVFTTGLAPGAQDDPRWGERVRAVEYLGREIAPRTDGTATVCVAMEIGVTFVERLGAP